MRFLRCSAGVEAPAIAFATDFGMVLIKCYREGFNEPNLEDENPSSQSVTNFVQNQPLGA